MVASAAEVCEARAVLCKPAIERWSWEALQDLTATPWLWKCPPEEEQAPPQVIPMSTRGSKCLPRPGPLWPR